MSTQNNSLNIPDLDHLHGSVILPLRSMFTKPIQGRILNHITLVKGLSNMIMHQQIENYFCFTKLILNNLKLEKIDIIGDYISLKTLVLCHNSIKDLGALNNLNELEYLDVSHNCLERILNFSPPKMLYYVDYSNNNIEYIDDLNSSWSLTYLNLSHNSIRNINGLQELKCLKCLNLSHNFIKQISDSLPCTLVEINLSYNDLEQIQWDMSLSMCKILNISHNKLKLLNFLKNAKQLSILNIENNMINDVLQIEFLKTLSNLRVLSAENNEFIELNIHKKIFSNNLPFKSIIDQTFIKTELVQKLNNLEVKSMLAAKMNAIKSTVLEHLSGKSPIVCRNGSSYHCNRESLPMVILVGPPKTRKKYLLNRIHMKHARKFYKASIYTTNDSEYKNKIFKTITTEQFNAMNCHGEFVFSYRYLGHSYGLNEDQLFTCISDNKILITFTNLEGALSLKLKGYNPIFVLVLPEDKLFYKNYISQSIIDKCVNQNSSPTENKTVLKKITAEQFLNETDNGVNISNSLKTDISLETFTVCSVDTTKNSNGEIKKMTQAKTIDDSYEPCRVFTNECMNNLNVCLNLYEKSTDIFHSLIYVDKSKCQKTALTEIISIMIDIYNNYYHINQKSEYRKQPNKHIMQEHIQARYELLYNELIE
ncbi:Leucine-rich repeat,P-loop containing nucleoside triphosphate hydrolase,Leucine-rich repeat domain, L [Cinara cedri]|uniref:Leucine-rich repeat,P-loop containing nucleoside triphosphate hydrolase,Leucine-rich repeat domain, L n=1 Tax=Cinara cedri TaxID=506608 RepID=A0A5E4NBH3_9HEMI|nr:Leucine-rich repeat,P-loop containing nucleoside triphosphate hydrolase,Leucine-rich repeat domain, L [Cinara cedri]